MRAIVLLAACALAGCIATYQDALERPVAESRTLAHPIEHVDRCVGASREFSNQPNFGGPHRPERTIAPDTGAIIYTAYLSGWIGMRAEVVQQVFIYDETETSTRVDVSGLDPAFGDARLPPEFWANLETCLSRVRA